MFYKIFCFTDRGSKNNGQIMFCLKIEFIKYKIYYIIKCLEKFK